MKPITIVKFKMGKCTGCEADLDADSDPHYIDTPKGRLWYCLACMDGITRLFDAMDAPYQIEEKNN